MKWIHNYQLFLFDFDGLLVNTEYLHYQAYLNVCSKRMVQVDWTFFQYCQVAHIKSLGVMDALQKQYPKLFENETDWRQVYQEKKEEYLRLIRTGKVELMPGVETLLSNLYAARIKTCVVTNSTKEQVDLIKSSQPLLQTIPYWITRELYNEPKPNPECYRVALQKYKQAGDKVIGFEDTIKGLKALSASPLKSVLICADHHPQMEALFGMGDVAHFTSFQEIQSI